VEIGWLILLALQSVYNVVKNNFLYVLIGVTFFILLTALIQIYMKLDKLEDIEDRLKAVERDIARKL